jgi:hypothetical protein
MMDKYRSTIKRRFILGGKSHKEESVIQAIINQKVTRDFYGDVQVVSSAKVEDSIGNMVEMAKSAKSGWGIPSGNVEDAVYDAFMKVYTRMATETTDELPPAWQRPMSEYTTRKQVMQNLGKIVKGEVQNEYRKATYKGRLGSLDVIEETMDVIGDETITRVSDEKPMEVVFSGQQRFDLIAEMANNPEMFGLTQDDVTTLRLLRDNPEATNGELEAMRRGIEVPAKGSKEMKALGSAWTKRMNKIRGTKAKPSDLAKLIDSWADDPIVSIKEHYEAFKNVEDPKPVEVEPTPDETPGQVVVDDLEMDEDLAALQEPVEPVSDVSADLVEGDTSGPWKAADGILEPVIEGELEARDFYGKDTQLTKVEEPKEVLQLQPTAGQDKANIVETMLGALSEFLPDEDIARLRLRVKSLSSARTIKRLLREFEKLDYDAVLVNTPNRTYMLSLEQAMPAVEVAPAKPIELPEGRKGLHEITPESQKANRPKRGVERPVTELTPREEITHGILAAKDYLRFIGTDPEVLAAIMNSGKVRQSDLQEAFLYVLLQAQEVMFNNVQTYGPKARDTFWDAFRKQVAKNEANKTKPGYEPMTIDTMLDNAAKIASDTIGPEANFRVPYKVDEFDFVKLRDKYRTKEPPTNREILRDMLEERMEEAEQDMTYLSRSLSAVGKIFGGATFEKDGFWRKFMSSVAHATVYRRTQADVLMGSTSNIMRRLVNWADSGRLMTGQLVPPGQHGIASWATRSNQAKRATGRIAFAHMKVNRLIGLNPQKLGELDNLLRKTHTVEGRDVTLDEIRAIVGDKVAEKVHKEMVNLRVEMVRFNTMLAELELVTGHRKTAKHDDADLLEQVRRESYFPMVINPEKLSKEPNFKTVIDEMVRVRTESLKAGEDLDHATMSAIGFIRPPQDPTPGMDHRVMMAPGTTNLDAESLSKLKVLGTFESKHYASRSADKIEEKFGEAGWDWFAVQDGDKVVLYQKPTKKSQLSDSDLKKYMESLDPKNHKHYIPEAKTALNGMKSVHHAGMNDMLDFKLGRPPYDKKIDGANETLVYSRFDPRWRRRGATEGARTFGFHYTNLSPQEVMGSEVLSRIFEASPTRVYDTWGKSTLFELLVQQDLDRMLGVTGVRIRDYLDAADRKLKKNAEGLLQEDVINDTEYKELLTDIDMGLRRIREMYADNSGMIRPVTSEKEGLVESTLDLMLRSSSAGFGMAAITETVPIIAKKNGLNIPRMMGDIVNLVRNILGDKRGRKGADDLAGTIFHNEALARHQGSRFLSEASYDLDVSANYWNRVVRSGRAGKDANNSTLSKVAHGVGNVLMDVGSLAQVTNSNRVAALIRQKVKTRKFIVGPKGNRLYDFLVAWNAASDELTELKNAGTAKAEAQLSKRFKDIARKNGFSGRDWEVAVMFVEYGITDPQMAKALEWGLKDMPTQFNPMDLQNKYWDLQDGTVGINPEVYEDAVAKYISAIEQRVIEEDISEAMNMAKITDPSSRTPFGRLWNSLLGFSRSFAINRGRTVFKRSPVNFLFQSIVLLGMAELFTGILREYAAGREVEDIMQQIEDDPEGMFMLAISRVPFLGAAQSPVAGVLNTVAGNEGAFVTFGVPFQTMTTGKASQMFKTIESMPQAVADGDYSQMASGLAQLTFFDSFVNRGFTALPVRMVEDHFDSEMAVGVQEFLDNVQREPYPHARRTRRQGMGSSVYDSVFAPKVDAVQSPGPSRDPRDVQGQLGDTKADGQRLLDFLQNR